MEISFVLDVWSLKASVDLTFTVHLTFTCMISDMSPVLSEKLSSEGEKTCYI